MAELSEKDLLLLSTLIYEDKVASGDKKIGTVGDLLSYYDTLTDAEWEEIEWRSDFGFMEENGTGDPVESFKAVLDE